MAEERNRIKMRRWITLMILDTGASGNYCQYLYFDKFYLSKELNLFKVLYELTEQINLFQVLFRKVRSARVRFQVF